MKGTLKLRSLSRSITAIFGTKNGVNPRIRYPDAYFRAIWFDKPIFDGIEWIAKIERLNKKKAARMLVERGVRSWLADKVREAAADNEILDDKLHRKLGVTRFIRALQKFVREHPIDSTDSKFT
jgi:hypothetical protein